MFKVLVTDALAPEGLQFIEDHPELQLLNRQGLSLEQLLEEVSEANALIVRSKTRVTESVMEAGSQLKVIGRAGAGVDNIDLAAATRKGIVVMNTPGGNSTSAAEHAMALMLSLARKIPFAHETLKDGKWNKSAYTGIELRGKTIGVLGLGKIGALVARRAAGFEMNVTAYDPFVTEGYAADLGVKLLPLEEVLSQADFLTLHLPLNQETRHVINRKTLGLLKKGCVLINAARGGLIHEQDLIAAVESGQLAGAALDVFEDEPQVSEALRDTKGIVMTPHIAGSTTEAQANVGRQIAAQVANFLTQGIISNAVNFPSLSPQERNQLLPYIQLGEKLGTLLGSITRLRVSEIGIRYYGELVKLNYSVISNYILRAVLQSSLATEVNEISAREKAQKRGISVIETVSSRERSYSNLISLQLRTKSETDWVEGAILHHGNLRLVSVDGIPIDTLLEGNLLFIRNQDKPGVIGQVGTLLGDAGVNIASFVLGRSQKQSQAIGIVSCDGDVSADTIGAISKIPAVQFVQLIQL